MNHLYYGDNLTRMQQMGKNAVDLIYLDPPFNSKQNYNMIYKTMTGLPVPDQAVAFCDTWTLDTEKLRVAKSMPVLMRESGVEDYYIEFWRLWMNSLRTARPQLLAYLVYMVERLIHMKKILGPEGSIWLHCDPTVSHYIKVMMDGIFGHKNFRNEIIWCYKTGGRAKGHFPKKHDVLLWYSKSDKFIFNYDAISLPRDFSTMHEPILIDPVDGRRYQTNRKNGKEYRYYEDKGVLPNDYWTDIPALNPADKKQRLGYPTQKPIALVERIIKACSDKSSVVFDPFCGCGTTIYAAEKCGRPWMGCDIAILSIKMVRESLESNWKLMEGRDFDVDGIPVSVEQAEVLFKRDPFQFQHWLVERIGGFPLLKKVADKGIDGRLYFETRHGMRAMVLSVKGGHLKPSDVRDLRGVLERESETEMAGFLSLKEPTKAMREEAAAAGVYNYYGVNYPRLQMLTVRDILVEKREFNTPTRLGSRLVTGQTSLALSE